MIGIAFAGEMGGVAVPKWAVGQAVLDMSIVFEIEETTGLWQVPVLP